MMGGPLVFVARRWRAVARADKLGLISKDDAWRRFKLRLNSDFLCTALYGSCKIPEIFI